MVWDAAGGHPAGPSDVPTARLYAAWKTERQDAAAVAELYGVSRADVLEAVRFIESLGERLPAGQRSAVLPDFPETWLGAAKPNRPTLA